MSLLIFTLLATLSHANAWTISPPNNIHIRTRLHSSPDAKNPNWQDCYDGDDDCLSTTYSAAFVAQDWIKSMPCGKDADCLPENLSHPGTMGDAGVEKVDVMDYLNIKRAAPVAKNDGSRKD